LFIFNVAIELSDSVTSLSSYT